METYEVTFENGEKERVVASDLSEAVQEAIDAIIVRLKLTSEIKVVMALGVDLRATACRV